MVNLSQGLTPQSPLGIALLIIGVFFSAGCIYIMSNHNLDSIEDQKRKANVEKERAQRIARLYPEKN